MAGSDDERRTVGRLKVLERYTALFAGRAIRSTLVRLAG
jgi:hypothetical protein